MTLAFASPLLLWALVALPVLWLLLRAVPPAPIRRRFPGVALLLGLQDEDRQADKTPWWLMLLRMAAIALLILGFAGPVLNPSAREATTRPLLILFDGGWAEAQDWARRVDAGRRSGDAGQPGRSGGRSGAVERRTARGGVPDRRCGGGTGAGAAAAAVVSRLCGLAGTAEPW